MASTDPRLSIIVVSYNTREMTLEALRSVKAQTKTSYELIVVDNASADGSAEAIAAEFPDIHLMAETANHGFAKANNIAAEHARGEYVLLLNPDTVVLDGAIDKLMAFAERTPKALIWGGRTVFGDGSLNIASCWRRMTLWNVFCRSTGLTGMFPKSEIFNSEAYGGWQRDTERAVDVVVGAFMLMPLSLWHKLGGFDLQFVMYGEEADLCLRARAFGADPRVTPEAEIIHYVGASNALRVNKEIMLLKAKALLIRRHFPEWQRPLALWLFRMWPLSRYAALSLLASLPGQGKRRASAGDWGQIWKRRGEWQEGYAPLPKLQESRA
ncbi:glycosyltransferase family 2 protein [Cereibacter sp. SYSU M97828]|nr:glycosyltransferase family 2 protein [Cereibacter flavus]